MLPEKRTKTNIGVGIGIVIQIARYILVSHGYLSPNLGLIVGIIALAFFTWGCMNYAEGKGHSKWFGLFGLLSCIGLVILIFMPDHHKESK